MNNFILMQKKSVTKISTNKSKQKIQLIMYYMYAMYSSQMCTKQINSSGTAYLLTVFSAILVTPPN